MKFRKAIGAIILDKDDNIISFETADIPGIWEGPEGGIDEGEEPIQTLHRELKEELDLDENDYEILKETKEFISYLHDYWKKWGFDGQETKFFLVKLNKNKEFKFDNTEKVEFLNYKITTDKELLREVSDFKRFMYEKVLKEFGFLKNISLIVI